MKHLIRLALSLALIVPFQVSQADPLRLSKKDKIDLTNLLQEPIEQMNKTINQLNAYAQQMQVIGDVTIHEDVHGVKHVAEKILAELHELNGKVNHIDNQVDQLNDKVDQAFQQIAILRILVGNPDDPSVDPAIFDSVQAIDESKLPIYQWLKTITRSVIEGTIVS